MKNFIREKFDLIKVIITAVLLAAATIIFKVVEVDGTIQLIVYIVLYLFIGYETIFGMIKEFKESPFNEDLLMVLATVGALIMGEYFEAVVVMLLFAVGELFEEYAEERTESAVTALSELMPDTASVLIDGTEREVKVDDIKVGDILAVKTGDRIVCDGTVLSGSATVDNSMLTGESAPISALSGNLVNSGGIVRSGYIEVEVTATADKSSANRILELVKEETSRKADSEKFIRRFAKVYTPIMILLAVLVTAIPPIFYPSYGEAFPVWLMRALNLLVISCPCALVISVPLAYFTGIGNAFKRGIIVKGGVTLEKASEVDAVVFDKTGTLTSGNFVVKKVVADDKDRALLIACSLEQYSNHPIATAIKSAYGGELIGGLTIEEKAGLGIVGRKDKTYAAGNKKLMDELGVSCGEADDADTVVFIAEDGLLVGAIFIGDEIKSGDNRAIGTLNAMNIGIMMLTGDNQKSAEKVATALGIENYMAGLMPEEKQRIVKELSKNHKVAFVGDGINDAPSLAASHLAVAMGSGTDVASLCSDVIITDNNVGKIPDLIKLSKKTARIVKENIYGSIAVKAAALVLSVVGAAPMWVAVLADVGVMVLASLNSLRLFKKTD